MKRNLAFLLAVALTVGQLAFTTTPAQAATCTSRVGPGIPAPASVPSGIPGYHAAWYGQSGYPTLCPGDKATSVVAYYNSGSAGWLQGVMGQAAYLGTWDPSPGQDRVSPLGGDGTNGSPATGWPRYNRIAQQPATWVGPGQVSWFQFTIQAPMTPGYYKLYLRPLIEGTTWMEDYGVYWLVTVLNPDGTVPPPPTPAAESGCRSWPSGMGWMMSTLPLPQQLCLLPYDQHPDLCGSSEGGCFLGQGPYFGGVYWPRNTIWVQSGLTASSELGVTVHETCHAHQARVASDIGYPDSWTLWSQSQEAAEFQTAWNTFKSQYPQGYATWGDRGQDLENAAVTCTNWYSPGALQTSSYPPLAQWAQKWLPK